MSYYKHSDETYQAHKKMLDESIARMQLFNNTCPRLSEIAEKNLTMLIPDVWDIMVRDLDNALPHTRRSCPDTPRRK
jgi:hypothetical protein